MRLIKKKLENGLTITMPEQANPVVAEIWDRKVYNRLYAIKDGDIVLDIGANIGIFSLYAASKGATVYSFEPNPDIFELLRKNIKDNLLEDRILPFNIALGGEDGCIELFVANSTGIYSEGSASTSIRYIEDLKKRVGADFRKYTVPCRTLGNIINHLEIESIDLAKLDCEGAEFDIINRAPFQILNKIKHIAMETHGTCYSQREICQMLFTKDIFIGDLEEATGAVSIGYIYGSSKLNRDSDCKARLIAEITSKNHVFVDETVEFDASNSFLINQEDRPFNYRWKIDDEYVESTTHQAKLRYQFRGPGLHHITLEVEGGGAEGSCGREIIVLQPDYYPDKVDYILDRSNTGLEAIIDSRRVAVIDSNYVPKFSKSGFVVVSITQLTSHGGLFLPLVFEFNGKTTMVNKKYMEIRLENIPTDLDVFFAISPYRDSSKPTRVKIKWWFDMENIAAREENSTSEVFEGNTPVTLSPPGQSCRFRFAGEKTFIISKNMLPATWIPRKAVIGITSMRYRNEQLKLSGYLNYKGQSIPMSDWYCESRLEDIDIDRDLQFTLLMPEGNCIKIAWWYE